MKKTTIDDVTPIKDYLICTMFYIDEKKVDKIILADNVKKEMKQPALKIRRISKDSKYKVGQVFLIGASLNATPIKINDIEYFILPEFEVRALVNDG